ncbi:MAG: uncharacterized protein JWM57_3542 [Phycisphaerales bacterium]|nr:uncharacterized protein [Phycisphaerales bacterium]
MTPARRRLLFVAASGLLLIGSSARAVLRPDELLLITNKNVPQSAALAQHYAQVRHVPAERSLALDLSTGEEMSAEEYDVRVAAPVKAFLQSPAGKGVRCLVTFYGVPLRVGSRPVTEADRVETGALRRLISDLDTRSTKLTEAIDAAAKSAGLTVAPGPATGILAGRQHFQAVIQQVQAAGQTPPLAMVEALKVAQQSSIAAAGAAMATQFPAQATTVPAVPPEQLQALATKPHDAEARAMLRRQVADQGGLFPLHQIAEQQLLWINGDETDAAVDNELALVLVGDLPRYRWQPNALHYQVTAARPVMEIMTCRIDAPTPQLATRLIDDTLKAEAEGLDGKAVFDSRGLPVMKDGKPDGYGWYDQAIRDAATFVKANTKVTVITDDREQVITPRAAPGTAIYCGWYSLRNYIPSCGFVTGAVGYHVASLELVSLHDAREKGWVANLIKDGVVATLGAVSEPYLSSFPRPEEFFPLLLTGKASLAEVFWATNPMTSWKIAFIGDPLYRPYAKRPGLTPEQLPPPLKAWLDKTGVDAAAGR